ncbi:type 2 lanthipeptide synthetase LanM family protein [Actinophytocola oryzae]|nr:type 2 lanthipeptide synthetase LanM family protein [Actinophytocola oryzae]
MTPQPSSPPGLPRTEVLPSGWWAPGLALAERSAPTSGNVVTEHARERVASWRAAYGNGERFAARLAAVGLDETGLGHLVAESPADLAARATRPAWVDTVERAVRAARPERVGEPDQRAAFAVPLRPFVANATADLTTRLAALGAHAEQHTDLPAVAAHYARRLSTRLVGIASRTLVHELATAASASDLATRLTEPAGLAALLAAYPVLARLLATVSTDRTDAAVELVARFAADRAAIVDALLGGTDPGPLTEVETGTGDGHRRGRSVALLTFADGRRVVYRPRDLAAHVRFTDAVRWLNHLLPDLGLYPVPALERDGYGWVAHVPARPLTGDTDTGTTARFHRRHGALLALLHALHATDCRAEHVVAHGDQPVLVDVETLFHPALADADDDQDPAARLLADSVQRVGLLPGTGTDDRATLEGFRQVYDMITRHRAEFAALLGTFADVEVRVVVRHARGYLRLLAESTRPELLRDALDRDAAFDLLWTESAQHPLRWQVCRHEQADLWAMDVPEFSTRPASADLWSSEGQRLPGALPAPDLTTARARVSAMSDVDRRDQEWIISAALATRAPAGTHRPGPSRDGLTGTAAPPERLLAAACGLADQVVARGLDAADRVNWLGIELVDDRRWMVLPMGAGLAGGYVGVALFLAQVAELSDVTRYGEVARRALRAVPRMLSSLADRPELVAAVGCGGLAGFGGIAYGLARLTSLLADDELRATTRAAVELAAMAAKTPGAPGVATGDAGCLAAATAVHTELGLAEAATLADLCADRLADLVRRTGGRVGTGGGFADGAAGVAWALTGRDEDAARLARANAHAAPGDLGWCSGLAGLALAGAADPAPLLAERPVLADLSLCHGELGVAEAVTVLAAAEERPGPASAARRRRAGLVLDAVNAYGPTCGVPGGVSTPGLQSGLAGIGYGLLRLGFAERVPSILLFEPSRSTSFDR